MERPHAKAEGFEQIPHNSRTRCNTDRGDRDEPVELAGRRYRAWHRAPAVEKARGRRERIAEVAASMARGSGEAGHRIKRIAVAFEAGRDGCWLARWLNAHDIETHVIDASGVAVSREH